MAPSKRQSTTLSDEGSDIEASFSEGTSGSHNGPRKRQRTLENPTSPARSQASSGDGSLMDSEAEVEYEQMATQAIRERNAAARTNIPAESGILESVHVENFMCHENFEFPLGPLINFICGKNGSGKSAILTALTLCLGGKASSTNRGQSLKNFIKEGKEVAIITVKIKNHGDGAYMHEEYGDMIIVERRFARTGVSGFKLKGQRGRVVSTRKSDLEDICEYFALQMDNPMNVLSQDMARQFIGGSNAAEKYKFFVKGVQLEQLDQDYRLIEENLDHIEAKLENSKPDINVLKETMEKAKSKLALSDRHDSIREKLRDYRRQLAWVQVEAQEHLRDEYVKAVEESDQKIAEAEGQLSVLDNRFQAADQASAEATAAHQQAEVEVNQLVEEKREAKAKHDSIKTETLDVQADQRNIRSALKEAEATINARKKDIADEEQRLAERDGGGAAARIAQLSQAEKAASEAKQEFNKHESDRGRLDRDLAEARASLKAHEEPLSAKRGEVERRKQELDDLSRSRGQQDLTSQPPMSTLLRAIENERSFAERPVGPLGRHVRLRKRQWSSILEKSFGATLNSFIVTSKRDMNILNGLMTRTRCSFPVNIANKLPLDTSPHEPDAAFETTLRVLDIDNDLVRKQLVILHGIEQTILIEDMERASRVLYSGDRPANVKRCYSVDGHDSRKGYMLSYTLNGEAKQDPVQEYVGRPRMMTDIKDQIGMRQEALQESKRELNELEALMKRDRDGVESANQAITRHKRLAEELKVAHQQADDWVEELSAAISEDNVEGGKLQVFKNALKEAEEQRTMHEASFQDAVVAGDAKKDKLRAARDVLRKFDERIGELQGRSKESEAVAQQLSKKRATVLVEKNAAIGRIDDAKQDRAGYERKRDEFTNAVAGHIEQALLVSQRVIVDAGATEESLRKKHHKLNADYEKYQREIGASREEIAANALRTDAAYRGALRQIRELEETAWSLKTSLIERRDRWKKFRNFIACRAKAQFTYLLSERSFRGKLIIDHKHKLLELRVEPDITKRSGSGRGAKTLSGGEKSYSQICLLLSIWEAMGSPIRCLDEFDVFMDSVNRKMSIDMLIGAARQSVGRQFVLISPGTKSDIRHATDVHSQELAPPERGQTALVF